MRSEQEMFDLILRTAREDDRIRAVIMNGSRANPNAPRDRFQDYDIVYLVTQMAPYIDNPAWQRDHGRNRMVTVGETPDPVVTMGGMRIVPDVTLDAVDPGGSAMLILPGAGTWLTGGNGAFADAARRFLDAGVT